MCSICELRIEFNIDHPMGLSVAVATRRAIDDGLLPEPEENGNDATRRARAITVLKGTQQRLEQVLTGEELLGLPDFFVLLIESRTWAFFRPTASGFDPNCIPDPPNLSAEDDVDRDAVIVVTETVLEKIVAGGLSFDAALMRGLVVVDADEERQAMLTLTFNIAYPKVGFSRFVCV